MQLTVRDVAGLLKVSEKTVYRWINDGVLPAYRVNDQYRFNRAELLEWATSRKMAVSPDLFDEPESDGVPIPSLVDALQAGGIFYRVEGTDRESALRNTVEHMRLPEEVDREFLLRVLLARENLQSTGIGDGIAIPHVRNPIVLHVLRPMITLCFLEKPVEFGALDGKPVNVLFSLISPTVRAHLRMLSRLSFALNDAGFKKAIIDQASRDEILELSHRIHAQPEPAFEERQAATWVAEAIARHGFAVEHPAGRLETAIRGTLRGGRGGERPRVGILAEYDALPGLGHGCGHNTMAASGVGAAIALASVAEELPGEIVFLGTPAEERGSGKQFMIDDGLFEAVIDYAGKLPSGQCEIFLAALGGATARPAPGATAYAHRDTRFVMNVHGRWDDPSEDERCIRWARNFFKASAPFAGDGVYVNFLTADEGERVRSAYGPSYDRLARVKRKYDPANLFRVNQNIIPA